MTISVGLDERRAPVYHSYSQDTQAWMPRHQTLPAELARLYETLLTQQGITIQQSTSLQEVAALLLGFLL